MYKGQSGKRNQLNRLQANLHPVSLAPLPPAIRIDGSELGGRGCYLRLGQGCTQIDSNFSPYIPAVFPAAISTSSGNTMAEKRELRLVRILAKQVRNKKLAKLDRRSRSDAEAEVLIKSFMCDQMEVDEDAMECEVCCNDAEMRNFWNEVCSSSSRDLLSAIEPPQQRNIQLRGLKPSRLQMLGC